MFSVWSFLHELHLPDVTRTTAALELAQGIAAEFRSMLDLLSANAASREPRKIDEAELLHLINAVLDGLTKVGSGPISRVIEEEVPEGSSGLQGLRDMADVPDPSQGLADRVTERMARAGVERQGVRRLVIASAIALSAGVAVPLLAGAAAETILTNEVAIAALILAVAALRKD